MTRSACGLSGDFVHKCPQKRKDRSRNEWERRQTSRVSKPKVRSPQRGQAEPGEERRLSSSEGPPLYSRPRDPRTLEELVETDGFLKTVTYSATQEEGGRLACPVGEGPGPGGGSGRAHRSRPLREDQRRRPGSGPGPGPGPGPGAGGLYSPLALRTAQARTVRTGCLLVSSVEVGVSVSSDSPQP